MSSRISSCDGYARKICRKAWPLVVFPYAVPSVWCHPITEQLISVVSVLVMLVQRRAQGLTTSCHCSQTSQAQHLKVLSPNHPLWQLCALLWLGSVPEAAAGQEGGKKVRTEHYWVVQRRRTPNHWFIFIMVSYNKTPNQYGRSILSMRLNLTKSGGPDPKDSVDFTENLNLYWVLLRGLICLEGLDLTWCLHPQPLSRAQEFT